MQFRPEFLNVQESPLVRIATAAQQRPDSHKLCYGESDMRPTPEFICRGRDGDRFCHVDLDRVRSAVDSRTRMLVVNSPSNPTGWVISRKEQEALWLLATEHDFMILSDDVYDRLVFDGPVAPSFATVATDRDHLIVVNGFSKSYNMTGWRLGYGLAGERLISLMTKANKGEFMTSSPPAMVQQAGIVARCGTARIMSSRFEPCTRKGEAL